jgi:hypothetical protein
MKFKIFVLTVLSLLFLFIHAIEYTELKKSVKLGDQKIAEKSGASLYYKFKIPSDFPPKEDLLIHVKGEESAPYSDPDIYIFRVRRLLLYLFLGESRYY